MESTLIIFPGNEVCGEKLAASGKYPVCRIETRHFPDGESYIRVLDKVSNKKVYVLCSLNQPDEKITPLLLLSQTLRDEGSAKIILIAPYLAYMRQDKQFHPGESVSAKTFASILSGAFDELISIDPHLHRIKSLNEVFSIPTQVLHTAPILAAWIKNNINNPLIVGPDEESYQWAEEVAYAADAPFIVLKKIRRGDNDVSIEVPDLEIYHDKRPVLIDDIISSAHTMHQTLLHILEKGMKEPVCIGVHGIFGGDAIKLLQSTSVKIITTNTIPGGQFSEIDISPLIGSVMS